MSKIILDLCGGTGAWSRPYKEAGYDVRVITWPEHDVQTYTPPENVYGVLAAPPCTMFSDARTNAKEPRDLRGGYEIVEACLKIIRHYMFQIKSDQQKQSPLKFWALENPWYGRLKWFMGNPTFEFNPWEFGDMYKKRTALWGYFNNPIKTHTDKPNIGKFDRLLMVDLKRLKSVNMLDTWKNTQTRQTLRSITPAGFAEAFFKANQ